MSTSEPQCTVRRNSLKFDAIAQMDIIQRKLAAGSTRAISKATSQKAKRDNIGRAQSVGDGDDSRGDYRINISPISMAIALRTGFGRERRRERTRATT